MIAFFTDQSHEGPRHRGLRFPLFHRRCHPNLRSTTPREFVVPVGINVDRCGLCHVNYHPSQRAACRCAPEFAPREEGIVKWFNRTKGFGFIIRENGDEIFVHHRSVGARGGQRANLSDGQRVTFTAVERSKGWQAEDVDPA